MRSTAVFAAILAAAAFGQDRPQILSQPYMSPGQVAEAEAAVQANPEDLNTRMRLLVQYSGSGANDPVRRLARLRDILYMVEHHPDTIDAASAMFYVPRAGGPYADAAGHESLRTAWLRQADAHPADSRIVLNAVRFLFVEDKYDAEQRLKTAVDNAPGDERLAANLGFVYAMDVLGLDSFAGTTAAVPEGEREQARQRATRELENSVNPAVLAGAATAIPNLAMRASMGRPVDPQLFELSGKLMAKARSLAPTDMAFRGPMPMIRYFEEAQNGNRRQAVASGVQAIPSSTGLPPAAEAAAGAPSRIRIGENVQKSSLVFAPQPEYPELARKSGIVGNVRFAAVIARDGSILTLQTISGHPLLIPAALEAVRQWRYRPMLLNGAPVEVVTDITVPFPPK